MDNKKSSKKVPEFYCELCNYTSTRKSQFERHLSTAKHKRIIMDNKKVPNEDLNVAQIPIKSMFACVCGRSFKYASGLCKHRKKCYFFLPHVQESVYDNQFEPKSKPKSKSAAEKDTSSQISDSEFKNMFLEMVQKNGELQTMLMKQNENHHEEIKEMIPKIGSNNNNTNKFNINIFLNEQCKDAINLMDFINTLHIGLGDLEVTGKRGYIEGITNILMKGLNELDTSKRPIHCTDLKREILYVKDNNEWGKENLNNEKMKRAIKHIGLNNMKQIDSWVKEHPDSLYSENGTSKEYNEIVQNSICESDEQQEKYADRIIKNVARNILLDKTIVDNSF